MKYTVALAAALLAGSTVVQAGEWALGVGGSDLFDEIRHEALAGLVEYHSDPFLERRWGSMSWMATAQFDNSDNYFVGVGAYAIRPLKARRIFFEASFAVGGYHQGTYVGKQADDILFRSSIGVGYRLKNEGRLSISLDSLLDTKLTFDNPGKEALLFRYTSEF